ncbi:MAG: SDR family NAD(P)-dependent oxidoreductase [Isosphaeraceae bacterium]
MFAEARLQGKVVLITGGRRVGSALARMLADRGASLAMTYHTSREAIENTIAEIQAMGVQGMAVGADLSVAKEAQQAVSAVVSRFGRLDVLVNMASVYRKTPLQSLTSDDFDQMIAANLAAPFHTAIAAARQMLTQEDDDGIKGKIVSIGDWASDRPYKDYLPYLVAKGGLATMTLALAKELAPHVPVAMIQPALIDPPADFTAADTASVIAQTPMRRRGTPDDVNRLILYLLEGTNFVTGVCYRVDGGRFLGQESS